MTPEELQKYWDALFIRGWRQDQTIYDVVSSWHSITKQRLDESNLLRVPKPTYPWKGRIKVFAAAFLPNINEWLWAHEPSEDVNLLRKLQDSKYDTLPTAYVTQGARDTNTMRKRLKKDKARNAVITRNFTNRNHDTDWNVVKGPVRSKIKRA